MLPTLIAQGTTSVFGKVAPPPGVEKIAGGQVDGFLIFISSLIRIATVIAGIWVLFNIIAAGYLYITAPGESSTANKARESITNSVIGLIIIVASYTIIALISAFLFKDPGFILNPTIRGV